MGYFELLNIANLMHPLARLVSYARYYKSLTICGLHYIHHVDESQAISICRPDNSTHHEATTFLLSRLFSGDKIKTVVGHARNLKKFLDYLLFWRLDEDLENIHLIPVKSGGPFPLEVILQGFADYLRCIPNGYRPFADLKVPSQGIQWSMLDHVPLNKNALAEGKVVPVMVNNMHDLREADWCEYPSGSLSPIIHTACVYLEFLGNRTKRFEHLPLQQIPWKEIGEKHSLIAGITGSRKRIVYDVETIARDSGVVGPKGGRNRQGAPIDFKKVFSEEDVNAFFKLLDPYRSAQDLLLFSILRYFGLRPGEAASLRLDPLTLPAELHNYHNAREKLTKTLCGELQYVKEHGLNGAWVVNTGWKTQASHRFVPLITHRTNNSSTGEDTRFPTQDEFTDLLYWALVQRQDLMSHLNDEDHGYLFVSASNNSKGKPLSEKGVYIKFRSIVDELLKNSNGLVDLRSFYPHSFRHHFATTLLRRYKISLEEIRQWLGHSSVIITRNTYIHWIPDRANNDDKGTVIDIENTFRKQAEISGQMNAGKRETVDTGVGLT
ncbi:tyrosine-type recombinase/integrase [Brevibacillus brevis]|uniref:tyrosine-type recombinase/integrase n=1 Tax=Brevibacillus brevis TaxID=1393 RepID=UPI00165E247B|nr:site-specific integrase [Brevibacillus brevis]